MNTGLVTITLVVVAGVLTAMQAPTNALLGRAVGSSINAALVSFVVGSLGLALAAYLTGARPDPIGMQRLPWYSWVGGIYGAVLVTVAAYAVPRIGISAMLTVLVASQLAASVTIDHMGALGLEARPVSMTRLLGLVLVIAGAALVRRG